MLTDAIRGYKYVRCQQLKKKSTGPLMERLVNVCGCVMLLSILLQIKENLQLTVVNGAQVLKL